MESKTISWLVLLIICSISCSESPKLNSPKNLSSEYLVNPIGIDKVHPRLRWQMDDERNAAYQKAYRIIVGTDSGSVAMGKGNLWDTQKVNSDVMLVNYKGKEL